MFSRKFQTVFLSLLSSLLITCTTHAITIDEFQQQQRITAPFGKGGGSASGVGIIGASRSVQVQASTPNSVQAAIQKFIASSSTGQLLISGGRGDEVAVTLRYVLPQMDLSADDSRNIILPIQCFASSFSSDSLLEVQLESVDGSVTLSKAISSYCLGRSTSEMEVPLEAFVSSSATNGFTKSLSGRGLRNLTNITSIEIRARLNYISTGDFFLEALKTDGLCPIAPRTGDVQEECASYLAQGWQNPADRLDVTRDNVVNRADYLVASRLFKDFGAYPLEGAPKSDEPYLDVNGDGFFSTLDIHALKQRLRDDYLVHSGRLVENLLKQSAESRTILINDIITFCRGKGGNNPDLDRNGDGVINDSDFFSFIRYEFGTELGDTNLDGIVSTDDFVLALQSGEYEDRIVGNSTWKSGDWNCDGEFDAGDLVSVMQSGVEIR